MRKTQSQNRRGERERKGGFPDLLVRLLGLTQKPPISAVVHFESTD
jgi:hypothetical protein